MPTAVNPKASARKGISHTAVVAASETTAATQSITFWEGREKTERRCERILKLWNISANEIVKNAIVVP